MSLFLMDVHYEQVTCDSKLSTPHGISLSNVLTTGKLGNEASG
jgi:hypothetical protein